MVCVVTESAGSFLSYHSSSSVCACRATHGGRLSRGVGVYDRPSLALHSVGSSFPITLGQARLIVTGIAPRQSLLYKSLLQWWFSTGFSTRHESVIPSFSLKLGMAQAVVPIKRFFKHKIDIMFASTR